VILRLYLLLLLEQHLLELLVLRLCGFCTLDRGVRLGAKRSEFLFFFFFSNVIFFFDNKKGRNGFPEFFLTIRFLTRTLFSIRSEALAYERQGLASLIFSMGFQLVVCGDGGAGVCISKLEEEGYVCLGEGFKIGETAVELLLYHGGAVPAIRHVGVVASMCCLPSQAATSDSEQSRLYHQISSELSNQALSRRHFRLLYPNEHSFCARALSLSFGPKRSHGFQLEV
jgi:hypothetical protein